MAESYKDPFYDKLDDQVTKQLGLPSGLLSNIRLKGEKSNASQVSEAGAKSVYQIIPATRDAVLKKYGVDAYESPEKAALAAGHLLKESLDRNKGNAKLAVREYHGGTNPKNWGKINEAYAGRVMGSKSYSADELIALAAKKFPVAKQKADAPKSLNVTVDQLLAAANAKFPKSGAKDESQEQPQQRGILDELGRQAQLTGRAAIEGIADVGGIVYDPIAATINAVTPDSVGYAPTLSSQGQKLADTLGLAKPESDTEKLVQQASKAIVGAGGTIGAGRGIAGAAPMAAEFLAAQPVAQAVASAGAAGGAEATRQAGGGEVAQLAAGLVGGLAPASLAGKAQTAAKAAKTAIPAEQQAIIAAGEKAGVPVMTSDVLPPETYVARFSQTIGEKIPVLGTGSNRAAQAKSQSEAVKNIAKAFGAQPDMALDEAIYGSLTAKKSADLNKYVGMKTEVLDSVPDSAVVNMTNTEKALQDEIDNLTRLNLPNSESTIKTLEDWKATFQGNNFKDIEVKRKAFGETLKDQNGRIPSHLEKVERSVYGAVKRDMDEFLKAQDPALANKWGLANKRLADGIAEQKGSKLKSILAKGDLSPEVVNGLLFSSRPSEVKILARNIGEKGKEHARAAIIKRMITDAGGFDNPSVAKFKTAMGKYSPQVDVFFDKAAKDQLAGFQKLLDTTSRAQRANFVAPTGEQLVLPTIAGSGMAGMGFWPALASAASVGAFARAYESPAVRNLMLKLAAAKQNSQQETALAQKLMSIIREQSNKDQKQENRF